MFKNLIDFVSKLLDCLWRVRRYLFQQNQFTPPSAGLFDLTQGFDKPILNYYRDIPGHSHFPAFYAK